MDEASTSSVLPSAAGGGVAQPSDFVPGLDKLRSMVSPIYTDRPECTTYSSPAHTALNRDFTVSIDGRSYPVPHEADSALNGFAQIDSSTVAVVEDRKGADAIHVLDAAGADHVIPLSDEARSIAKSPFAERQLAIGTKDAGVVLLDLDGGSSTSVGQPDGAYGGVGFMTATASSLVASFEDLPEDVANQGGPWNREFAHQVNLYQYEPSTGWTRLTDLVSNDPAGFWYLAITPHAASGSDLLYYVVSSGKNDGGYEDFRSILWVVDIARGADSAKSVGLLPPFTQLNYVGTSSLEFALTVRGGDLTMYTVSSDGSVTPLGCQVPVDGAVGTDPDVPVSAPGTPGD